MAAPTLLLHPKAPPSYHRIISPSLHIPTDTSTPIPVGLLACQRDPFLRELTTCVVSCLISQPPPPPKKSKKSSVTKSVNNSVLEVTLHDTIIFPEGGGQPSDIGHITSTINGETYDVMQAKRVGGHAVHYVCAKNAEDDVLAFYPGAGVRIHLGEDGYNRRYDHMTMHTSQHLISALLETRLNIPTLSWSLTTPPTPCYVELPRSMTVDEISSIQDEANRLVFEGRQVHIEVEELDAAQDLGARKLESGRAVGRGLPDDYTGGVKRVVVIDGVDRNPCCGTHLPTLHNLQLFLLPHAEALARSSTTSARLYFLAGPRLIAHLSSSHSLLTGAASILSCGAPQVPERVGQVIDERKRAEKRTESLELELASRIANDILTEFFGQMGIGELFTSFVHRTDDSNTALGFLSAISTSFVSGVSVSQSIDSPYLIILASSPSSQASTNTNVVLIFGSDENRVKEAGEGLKKKLGVKGGGKGPRWSGKFVGVWKGNPENLAVEEVLEVIVGRDRQ